MRFLPKLTWKQPGGLKECPYFYRYVLDFGFISLRLHHWLGDDDHRAYHDHPYWFLTFILKGGYDDVSITPKEGFSFKETLRAGMFRYRPAEFRHSVQNVLPGTWTFLITGKPSRRWAFWINGKKLMRDKYFAVWGHHPCDPTDKDGVKVRPDGTRI
jgi:hypothetical protein